ncbi:MAG: hypothetical protein PF481_10290 [Bacteroidales bacterium]|jgi:hypothetical protein|nr:hypothetical protein [Bacteroidales bacterium]
MNVQAEINWIVSELSKVRDPELIKAFKNMLIYRAKHNQVELVDELPLAVQESIKRGVEQAKKGEMRTNLEVKKKYEKWL